MNLYKGKKIAMNVITAAILGASSMCIATAATPTAISSTDSGAMLIEKISHQQLSIDKVIPVSKSLTAYLASPKAPQAANQKIILFVADGQYVIAGNVMNAQGENLTESLTQTYITSIAAKSAYAEVGKTAWFQEGSDTAAHKVYIVIDPNCIFCHMLYEEVQPLIANGTLQVRWVPVGFLKPDSMPKAVAIWMAKDQVAGLKMDETNFNTHQEEGGITPVEKSTNNPAIEEAYAKIAANTAFFAKNNFQGTPTLLYIGTNGQPNFYPGYVRPSQMDAFVSELSDRF